VKRAPLSVRIVTAALALVAAVAGALLTRSSLSDPALMIVGFVVPVGLTLIGLLVVLLLQARSRKRGGTLSVR
jgi:hypothetical protein